MIYNKAIKKLIFSFKSKIAIKMTLHSDHFLRLTRNWEIEFEHNTFSPLCSALYTAPAEDGFPLLSKISYSEIFDGY